MSADGHVRIGIVGAGGVGERHARVLTDLPGASVVGVADHDGGRARRVAVASGAEAFPDARALVETVQPDALYVCVPPFAHGGPERVALERDLPLFVEKPLAADLATAEVLAAEVAAAGVVTATGYHWRHLDTVGHARELLAGRTVGLVAAHWLDRVPPPAWWTTRRGSGGQVVEQATHLIDLIRHVAGEVDAVTALGTSVGHCGAGADIDEATAAALRLASGAVGTLTTSCLSPSKRATTLDVVTPGLAVELSEDRLVVHDSDGVRQMMPQVDARRAVDEGFLALVRGDEAPAAVPYAEALRTHRVGCALAASAAGAGEVRLPPTA
jgi:myo-inositol 2-dehydrogenase / D-chiro-inositol 1-dehydrogenase